MDPDIVEQLKGAVGEKAAREYERSYDAGMRLMKGNVTPYNLVSNTADYLLATAYAAAHLTGLAAGALGKEAGKIADVISEKLDVSSAEKPLGTPTVATQVGVPKSKGK